MSTSLLRETLRPTAPPDDEEDGLTPLAPPEPPDERRRSTGRTAAVAAALLAGVAAWAYWPTLRWLGESWWSEPDYSHGLLAAPVCAWLLWLRRDRIPRTWRGDARMGLAWIAGSVVLHAAAVALFITPLQGWSLLMWIAGMCWLLGGRAVLAWCWPALAVLMFAIPLPYRAEQWLSLPLQRGATTLSCGLLQCLGEPAVAEGNVILLRELRLEVAEACSGVRLVMGFVAMSFLYAVVTGGPFWRRSLLLAAAAPIAVLANAFRIAATGWFANRFAAAEWTLHHDAAGWGTLLLAAMLSGLLLALLNRMIVPVEAVRPIDVLQREVPS